MMVFDVTLLLAGYHWKPMPNDKAEWAHYETTQHEVVYAEGPITESDIERFIWERNTKSTNWSRSDSPSLVKVTVTPRIQKGDKDATT